MNNSLGKLVIADMYGITPEVLDDIQYLEQVVIEAVSEAGMTLIYIKSHEFTPIGVTVVAILAESHLAIHTYPEYGYMAVDCFTCGDKGSPEKAIEYIESSLMPSRIEISYQRRGTIVH